MPCNFHRFLVLSILSILLFGSLQAQDQNPVVPQKNALVNYIQNIYGQDQVLINGFQYYTRNVKYKGDPFYPEDAFFEGSVFIGNKSYDHIQLKYNCFSQDLILEYTDYQERYNQLILNSAHIDSFRLGSDFYQKLDLFGERPLFYQVLRSGSVSSYIHWEKDIHTTNNDLQYSHEYTKPLGTYYIHYKGVFRSFTNRKSLLSIFPETMAAKIKKYLRDQRFPVKNTDPDDIQDLLNYIKYMEDTQAEQ